MESHRPIDDRDTAPSAARRVLVAVHGGEPARWDAEVGRILAATPRAAVRVLALVDVPAPPSVALLACARRARAGARAEWRQLEAAGLEERVAALLAWLPAPDVTRLDVADADPARAIVERAAAWGADLIVVGAEPASWIRRRLLGAVHERVVARATCAVLVVSPPAARPARGRDAAPARDRSRPVPARREA
jgi:nucleotide-binding universal stress UspA family protein